MARRPRPPLGCQKLTSSSSGRASRNRYQSRSVTPTYARKLAEGWSSTESESSRPPAEPKQWWLAGGASESWPEEFEYRRNPRQISPHRNAPRAGPVVNQSRLVPGCGERSSSMAVREDEFRQGQPGVAVVDPRRWRALFVLALVQFMIIID